MEADWWVPLIAAPFVGSVLGVLVRRLPAGRPVVVARSACEACGHGLVWWELVPLLSFAGLRGRCSACGTAIAPMHWQIELAALAAAAVVVAADGATGATAPLVWADCGLAWGLLALAWIDVVHRRLPDVLTLPLAAAGLAVTAWLDPDGLRGSVLGAVAGYASFRLVALAYRGWRGRDGLGHGDAKLMAAAGAWVGWQGLGDVVLLGALVTIGVVLARARGRWPGGAQAVPFGPGLAVGLLAVRLHG